MITNLHVYVAAMIYAILVNTQRHRQLLTGYAISSVGQLC